MEQSNICHLDNMNIRNREIQKQINERNVTLSAGTHTIPIVSNANVVIVRTSNINDARISTNVRSHEFRVDRENPAILAQFTPISNIQIRVFVTPQIFHISEITTNEPEIFMKPNAVYNHDAMFEPWERFAVFYAGFPTIAVRTAITPMFWNLKNVQISIANSAGTSSVFSIFNRIGGIDRRFISQRSLALNESLILQNLIAGSDNNQYIIDLHSGSVEVVSLGFQFTQLP